MIFHHFSGDVIITLTGSFVKCEIEVINNVLGTKFFAVIMSSEGNVDHGIY